MRVLVIALLVAGVAVAQEKPAPQPAGPDRVMTSQRETLSGEITALEDGANLLLKTPSRTLRLSIEEVSRITFEDAPKVAAAAPQRLQLVQGGLLGGAVAYADGRATVDGPNGSFTIARKDVKSIVLGSIEGSLPELKDEKKDILLYLSESEKGKEMKAEYGELVKIDKEKVWLKIGDEEKSVARAAARVIHIHEEKRAEVSQGWFTKLIFMNGDKLVGVLKAVAGEKVTLFSHYLGTASFSKKDIHSITFVPAARMSVGNIIVCDQAGVHEYTRNGAKIWSLNNPNINYPWSANKLENGNILIANTNYNQVIEVKPKEGGGGDIVWQLDNVQYPYDVQRLENGNTLVAEYYASSVVEYDQKTKTKGWNCGRLSYPISAQRLENGNTLIASNYGVVEVDNKGAEKWRANLPNVQPWRASRLDNGNTLVVDMRRGRILEITTDKKCEIVWSMEGLSRPVAAVRLDDGNTLIMEQGANQIIEVDPLKKQPMPVVKNLNYPLYMSTY
jgi:hypothetical protein